MKNAHLQLEIDREPLYNKRGLKIKDFRVPQVTKSWENQLKTQLEISISTACNCFTTLEIPGCLNQTNVPPA